MQPLSCHSVTGSAPPEQPSARPQPGMSRGWEAMPPPPVAHAPAPSAGDYTHSGLFPVAQRAVATAARLLLGCSEAAHPGLFSLSLVDNFSLIVYICTVF